MTSHAVSSELIDALGAASGVRVRAQHQPREQRRIWLEMAAKGAELSLARLLAEEGSQQQRTRALIEALDLDIADPAALRVECFDISHTAGEATQASCVVFEGHQMQSASYRRFNIEGITGGDDYAAMRQVLTRRYARLAEAVAAGRADTLPDAAAPAEPAANGAESEIAKPATAAKPRRGPARLPDLVLVDGGRGQVAMAREGFAGLGLDRRQPAGGHCRRRPAQAGAVAAALWRPARRGQRRRRRPGQRGRHFQGTGRGDLSCPALTIQNRPVGGRRILSGAGPPWPRC